MQQMPVESRGAEIASQQTAAEHSIQRPVFDSAEVGRAVGLDFAMFENLSDGREERKGHDHAQEPGQGRSVESEQSGRSAKDEMQEHGSNQQGQPG